MENNKINLMLDRTDLEKFKFSPNIQNIPNTDGIYLLIHKKTNNFYFNYSSNLKQSIILLFENLNKQKHPNIKLQTCVYYGHRFDIYVRICNNSLESVSLVNQFIEKYQISNLLLNDDVIKFKKYSEFEIQTIAYSNLINAGYNVRGEYRYWYKDNEKIKSAIFDIAVFNENHELILIIEVKRSDKTSSIRQAERYTKISGIKTIYVRGIADACNIVSTIKQEF